MSAQTIERELETYLAHSEYEVSFVWAEYGHNWFYVRVTYLGKPIAQKAVVRSHRYGGWWARRKIRAHQKTMQSLGPLVRP